MEDWMDIAVPFHHMWYAPLRDEAVTVANAGHHGFSIHAVG
jgi:hypothetical protein